MGGDCLNVGHQSSNRRHDFVHRWHRRLGHQHGVLVKLGRVWGPTKSYKRTINSRDLLGPLARGVSGLSTPALVPLLGTE
jgi:hypothetical protein